MKLITTELIKKIPKEHKAMKYFVIDLQDIEKTIKVLKNKKTIKIYDLTISSKLEKFQIIPVNDHINRTGKNPLITRQKELKIDFLDSTKLYKQKKKGIITDCCGERLNKNYLFPSHYLSNISILAKALKINKFSAYLINAI